MKTDWTTITRGMGDSGVTSGSYCALHKSDRSILFQALLEEAQLKLGKVSQHSGILYEFRPEATLKIETQFRKIMGKVSGHKNLDKYLYTVGLDAVLHLDDLLAMDELVISLGSKLNQKGVPMGWVNYTDLTPEAMAIAEFTTSLRTAECVFHQFLKEEAEHSFSHESRFLNRLSKVSHLGMVLQDYQDKNQF